MGNCLIAQSGGPTAVINASLAGIIRANQICPLYDRVLGALGGIEGAFAGDIVAIDDQSARDLDIMKQTPGAVIGSCRYDFKHDDEEAVSRLFTVMAEHDITTFFYIGGNGSMDTVAFLAEQALAQGKPYRFVGVPKTVDNDLICIDHCPGFPSAAKFAQQMVRSTWCDVNAYERNEVYILETMGRDAGWSAGAAAATDEADLCIMPERAFVKDRFLSSVARILSAKPTCYVVVSEGARYEDGTYISADSYQSRGVTYARLGGASAALSQMILSAGITPNVKAQDLSSAARAAMFAQAPIDVSEAFELGMSALLRSADPEFSGQIPIIVRDSSQPYAAHFESVGALEVANKVKNVPDAWIRPGFLGVTDEFREYLNPLIQGETHPIMDGASPAAFTGYMGRIALS
jgi:6-phosphofructokinase 1